MPPSVYHRGWHRGTGDATHSQTGDVTEILLPGSGTETFSRQLHISQASAANSDWNLAAQSHPTLVLHSTTTPITDYILMNHDGTTAQMDGVGATALDLKLAGNEVVSLASTASAVNEVSITNAATSVPPDVSATGGDTNISLAFTSKGTGHFRFDPGGTEAFALHDTTCNPVTASTSGAGHPVFMYTAPGLAATSAAGGTAGGLWTLETGVGGAAHACNQAAAAGGALSLAGGIGGASATSGSGNAGAGGAISATGGNAGAITAGTGCPGVGGVVTLTGGVGSTSSVACDVSGAGGAITLASGAGGANTGSGNSNDAGVGGNASLSGGAGGASTNALGGNGGDVTISVGAGGVGSGSGNGGDAGDIYLRTETAVESGAVGGLFIRNATTGLGISTAAVSGTTWTDVNAGAGNVYTVTGWLSTTQAPANVGVMVIETA